MIPVFSVVGKNSNTGKTTMLCRIIEALKERGYRVATIKHDVHGFEMDRPGKDTWKHRQAGSDMVMISSPNQFAMIEQVKQEYTLDALLSKIKDIDIVITEGYKQENKPKLEIYRREAADEPLANKMEVFAMVTDQKFDIEAPQFSFEELEALVNLIEDKFLLKTKGRNQHVWKNRSTGTDHSTSHRLGNIWPRKASGDRKSHGQRNFGV